MIGFGYLDDDCVQRAIEWQVKAMTGDATMKYTRGGTVGPGFACGINVGEPWAWGAIKAMRAFARIPEDRRDARVRRAITTGLDFLLSRDPAKANYPAGRSKTREGTISPLWFSLGFPSGFVSDVLQDLEVLAMHGRSRERDSSPRST